MLKEFGFVQIYFIYLFKFKCRWIFPLLLTTAVPINKNIIYFERVMLFIRKSSFHLLLLTL